MKTIFDRDFYPTPDDVIQSLLANEQIEDKIILEPSAGTGNIVSFLQNRGAAEVLACEKDEDFAKLLAQKCRVIANDFFTVTSDQISHIHAIYMNPPFSADAKHILHAWNIAPAGCRIVSLHKHRAKNEGCYGSWEEMGVIIKEYGYTIELGQCFNKADRPTDVEVDMTTLVKPGGGYETEFEGFFLDEDPAELQANALMPYNFIRDIVNRYIGAVKIYDEQLNSAVKLNDILGSFYGKSLAFQCTDLGKPKLRNDFKKELQKDAWKFVFDKMDLNKHSTQGLRDDMNKFVEQNQQIPFTMRNIYRMLDIVIGTTEQRMDKALLEVFEKATKHHDENRYNVEGWKTNSHFLLNEKFIFPYMCEAGKYHTGSSKINTSYGNYFYLIEDLVKALCYITGDSWESFGTLSNHLRYHFKLYYDNKVEYFSDDVHYNGALDNKRRLEAEGKKVRMETSMPMYGELFTWAYFEIRAYKKGTMHFRFKSRDLWAKFNQRIAQLLGYPLPESIKTKKPFSYYKPEQPKPPVKQALKTLPVPETEPEPEEPEEMEMEMETFTDPAQLDLFGL